MFSSDVKALAALLTDRLFETAAISLCSGPQVCSPPRSFLPLQLIHEIVWTGETREADLDSVRGKAEDVEEETGTCTPRDRRDRGPGTQGRIHT
jgi:hypothetical protein